VSFNNYEDEYEYAFEAGGMKIVNSVDVTIESNYVHNNHGPGIWTDINNVGARILRNIAQDNYGPGIFHEISYSALISENVVTGNGFGFYIGGILVASSSGVEISANAVLDNDGGIVAIQEDRGGGRLGEFVLDSLVVHRNLVAYSEGFTGVLDQVGNGEIFRRSISFSANTYMDLPSKPFAWNGRHISLTEWLAVHPTDR
jgi:parallel beta-helix repeat protein